MGQRPLPCDQAALPFSLFTDQAITDPCSPDALKAAYTASGIWRWCTFEQAMATPSIRIALSNAAEAAARRYRKDSNQPREVT